MAVVSIDTAPAVGMGIKDEDDADGAGSLDGGTMVVVTALVSNDADPVVMTSGPASSLGVSGHVEQPSPRS